MDKRTFRNGVSDQAEAASMQGVLQAIARNAPGVNIVVGSGEMRLGADLLATCGIDLTVGYCSEVEGELEVATLYHQTFVCLFNAKACGAEPPLSLGAYVALALFGLFRILVSLRGQPFGHLDELLEAVGRSRAVVYTMAHFLVVPFCFAGSAPCRLCRVTLLKTAPTPPACPSVRFHCRLTARMFAWFGIAEPPPTRVPCRFRAIIAAVGQRRTCAASTCVMTHVTSFDLVDSQSHSKLLSSMIGGQAAMIVLALHREKVHAPDMAVHGERPGVFDRGDPRRTCGCRGSVTEIGGDPTDAGPLLAVCYTARHVPDAVSFTGHGRANRHESAARSAARRYAGSGAVDAGSKAARRHGLRVAAGKGKSGQ